MRPNIIFLLNFRLIIPKLKILTDKIILWYQENKRVLPWRNTKDPYKIWVSEIILQQTQIKTGIKYYVKFLSKYPTIQNLAKAQELELLKIWEGLGYYNRALNMMKAAKQVIMFFDGIFPTKYTDLIQLKGVGEYTASAISSICKNEKRAVLDGNVYRVLSRIYNIKTPINTTKGKMQFQKIANSLLPNENTGIYNQAIMDFGSIHCTKHNPKCIICPTQKICQGFQLNLIKNRPVKKKKITIKNRYFNYLLINNNNLFIVKQRGVNDIWKKLYELPLIESKSIIKSENLKQSKYIKKFDLLKISKLNSIIHKLSHQKLNIQFWNIKVSKNAIFNAEKKINIEEVDKYPFPIPLKNFFNKNRLL